MTDTTMPKADNASLALQKFDLRVNPPVLLPGSEPVWSKFTKTRFAAAAEVASDTGDYGRAYDAWKVALRNLPGDKADGEFTVNGRMIVGIGQASVLENSITLHRLWGTPFIPGSALKGLARHYAQWLIAQSAPDLTGEVIEDLFGTTENSGLVTFHDAWYVPNTARDVNGKPGNPLIVDVVTGHHGDWYMQKEHPVTHQGVAPPWDFTDPNPVTLISARGRYLIVVQADPGIPEAYQPATWAKLAMDLLGFALEDWGIGAKTNAGYGRLVRDEDASGLRTRDEVDAEKAAREAATKQQEADAAYNALLAEIEASTGSDPNQPNAWYQKWKSLTDVARKLESGTAILTSWKANGQYNRLVIGKPESTKPKDQPKAYAKEIVDWVSQYEAGGESA